MNKTITERRIVSTSVAVMLGWVIVLGSQASAEAMPPPPDGGASSTTEPSNPKPGEHLAKRPAPVTAHDEPASGKRPTDDPKPGEHLAKRPAPVTAHDEPASGKRPTDDPKPGEHLAKRPTPVTAHDEPQVSAKTEPAFPASEASAYLSRRQQLNGSCTGTYSRIIRSDIDANPDNWNDSAKYEGRDEGGIFITGIFRQSGATRYDLYEYCTEGSNHRVMGSPTAYAHRSIRQNFYCLEEGACNYLSTQYGPWTPGV